MSKPTELTLKAPPAAKRRRILVTIVDRTVKPSKSKSKIVYGGSVEQVAARVFGTFTAADDVK